MDLQYLHYFMTVAEEMNITRAAERLGMAQPPLTRIIHGLEDELGVQLFDRSKRQISLTPAGQVFLEQVSVLLAHYQEAVHLTQRVSLGEMERLNIGFTDAAISSILPAIVRVYSERFPQYEVVLRDLSLQSQKAQIQALLEHRIDLIFMSFPPHEKRIRHERLLECPLAVVLPATHRLANQEAISVVELAQEPWVWCPRQNNPRLCAHVLTLCQQAGFEPRIAQTVNQPHVMTSLVAAGIGISIVTTWSPFPQPELRGIVYRPLKDPTWQVDLQMVWRETERAPSFREFLKVAREVSTQFAREADQDERASILGKKS